MNKDKINYCPFCGSHKLVIIENEFACDECGGVFTIEIVSEPQEEIQE